MAGPTPGDSPSTLSFGEQFRSLSGTYWIANAMEMFERLASTLHRLQGDRQAFDECRLADVLRQRPRPDGRSGFLASRRDAGDVGVPILLLRLPRDDAFACHHRMFPDPTGGRQPTQEIPSTSGAPRLPASDSKNPWVSKPKTPATMLEGKVRQSWFSSRTLAL